MHRVKKAVMNVEEAFLVLAKLGDNPEFLEKELQRHDPLYEELIQYAKVKPESSVLELGCGTGAIAIKLAQRMGPRGKVLGVDVNRRMLETAKEKRKKLGLRNLDIKIMTMENLDLPDNMFDSAISSFGVCCCFHYDRTLREAYRVLTPGGTLSFNQDGPNGIDKDQIVDRIFTRYKPSNPSQTLKKKREANALHERLTKRYRDPFKVLALMRQVGFGNAKSFIKYFTMAFPTIDEYLDYYFFDSLTYAELDKRKQQELRRKCSAALKATVTANQGLAVNQEVVYFTGQK